MGGMYFCYDALVAVIQWQFSFDLASILSELYKFTKMPRHPTEETLSRGIGMLQGGLTQRAVAINLGISKGAVSRAWIKFRNTGTIDRKVGSGRPRKTTPAQDHFLQMNALRNRTVTAPALNRDLQNATGVTVSNETVRKRLHEAHLLARRPAVRVPVTVAHRRHRLTFAQNHLVWGRADWDRVLFTDESKFNLDFNDGRIRVWRRPGERFADCCVQEHDRYGGGSVMVWGGISLTSRVGLRVIGNGTLNGQRYRDEILDPYVLPYAQNYVGTFILMDDNARPHRNRLVDAYKTTNGINGMEWPARSPDLNPIEHVWDMLQRAISNRLVKPQTVAELQRALLDEWANIPQLELQNLIMSMPHRCQAVVTARGGHTRY